MLLLWDDFVALEDMYPVFSPFGGKVCANFARGGNFLRKRQKGIEIFGEMRYNKKNKLRGIGMPIWQYAQKKRQQIVRMSEYFAGCAEIIDLRADSCYNI
ncbi:MAG: hypothetical protein IJX53_03355 [Clostridia bacterium]|nr:hypothetical protein [Clostridia bacterium]